MKQIRLILVIALGFILGQSTKASTVVTEQFQNYATGQLGASGTGNTGIIPGTWLTPSATIVVSNLTPNVGLTGTNLGLVASDGDMAYIMHTTNYDADASGHPNGCYMVFANKNTPLPAFPGTNAANVYCSFLYQINSGTNPTNFATNGISQILTMHRQNSGVQSTADASYWRLFVRSNSLNTVQLGICKNPYATVSELSGGPTNWDSTAITVGQTFFVVVRLQIAASNSATLYSNDVVDLWINPTPSTFGTNEANVPTPDVTLGVGVGAVDASTTGPGRLFVFDNGLSANIDEIRIATNWADATPPFGQCLSASITTSPTNVTQSAEISAIFLAKAANSTSPNYQWQLSQNGGATWSNISNATENVYTTPNLQLATDNGNKYRVVVGCDCDGSLATSAVATVTLTAPTVTPSPSIIMNDAFPGSSFRDVGPVTTTHSVWYTGNQSPSASSDLVTDPGGSGLQALPISGSSSLYLGYFVNETSVSRLPVHLAVGTEIIATLQFIPNPMTSFTNNGALRFGLFDYADSGTLYTGDDSTLTGSLGNGLKVRGYMLSFDYGTSFSSDLPLNLLVRNGILDNNLMGTTGDYLSMLSGPVGNGPGGIIGNGPAVGTWSNAPAIVAGTTYTLTLTVARTGTNVCTVAATLTGGSMNLSYAAVDTNSFGYHRFDTIAIRPNRLENSADMFTFPLLTVQVTNIPVQVSNVGIQTVQDVFNGTNRASLTWLSSPANADTSLGFTVGFKNALTNENWTRLRSGLTATNYTDSSYTTTNKAGFYRVTYP
jgi:hypothetical protein